MVLSNSWTLFTGSILYQEVKVIKILLHLSTLILILHQMTFYMILRVVFQNIPKIENRDFCFFHGMFHGYTHKCTKAFRCNRLLGFSVVNSSISKQFDSYIQKIKASARLMSQAHFILYLQFFIHRWNQMKFESFRKKLRNAVSGRNDNFLL